MLVIYLKDNTILVSNKYDGKSGQNRNTYNITDCGSLNYHWDILATIKMESDPFYYPISQIVKFADMTEGEILSLNRDIKLDEILKDDKNNTL
jgi:hypothetical protein